MIRRTLSSRSRRAAPPALIPYAMFDPERPPHEVRAARKMERVYHLGQDKIWDGKEQLTALVEKHGGIQATPERLASLGRIFSVIFWGELAAWKVSAELALVVEPLEAKMAATSQAHDEARHFYVLHDYLEMIGYRPEQLPGPAARVLDEIVGADSLAKKLLGMQLMVEPIALTLFQVVRRQQFEPVLCDLLKLYERDEARHIALGVHYLPRLLAKMGRREMLDLWAWQMKMFMIQLDGLALLEPDIRALGLHPRDVLRLGQAKQLHAAELMMAEMGLTNSVGPIFERVIEARLELQFPRDEDTKDLPSRLKRAARGLVYGPTERVDGSLEVH